MGKNYSDSTLFSNRKSHTKFNKHLMMIEEDEHEYEDLTSPE